MANTKVLSFFQNGNVFLFDEMDYSNEKYIIMIEDLMVEEEGANIFEIQIDSENGLYLYYDASVLSEQQAFDLYFKGEYSRKI